MKKNVKKGKTGPMNKVLTVIGAFFCVLFSFMLVCNLTIIIKGTIYPEKPPTVLGTTPLVVLSGSMSGTAPDHIEAGDLIFVGKTNAEDLEIGDIIAFMQGQIVVTHRIMDISEDTDGSLMFTTKGDANNTEDQMPVPENDLVGIYKGRIPKVGDFAIFMQTPLGMILFIGVPLLAFIIYDIVRRQHYLSVENKKTAELEAELERLRTLAGEKE